MHLNSPNMHPYAPHAVPGTGQDLVADKATLWYHIVASGYYKTLQEAMSRMPSEFEMVPVDKRCRRYHLYKYHIYREMWRDQIKYRIMMDGVNRAVFDAAIPDDIDEEAYDQRLLSGDITFEEMLFGLKKANGNLPGWLPKNNIKIPSTNAMHWFPQAKQQD